MKKLLLATALALGMATTGASATTYELTSDHCSGGTGGNGCLLPGASGGTVTTTNVVGGVQVNVTLNSGIQFINAGFPLEFAFNLIGDPTITYSLVTAGWTPQSGTQDAGSFHMDGFQNFEYGLVCAICAQGGSNPFPGPLNFTITGAGLTTASFELSGGGMGSDQAFFVADVIGN